MWGRLEWVDERLPKIMVTEITGRSKLEFWSKTLLCFVVIACAAAVVGWLAWTDPLARFAITLIGAFALLERLTRVPTNWAMLLATVGFFAALGGSVAYYTQNNIPTGAYILAGTLVILVLLRLGGWGQRSSWRDNMKKLSQSINGTGPSQGPCPSCGKYRGV